MSFRTRLLLAFAGVVVVPLAVLVIGVRAEVGKRLSSQFQDRVTALASGVRSDLGEQSSTLAARLAALSADVASDNRFRLALHAPSDHRYLLDYAGQAMRRGGLTMLLIQDSTGRILSSGHFRNEYDRVEVRLGALLPRVPEGALVRVRTADGTLLTLARADSVDIAGERLTIVGGLDVSSSVLRHSASDPQLSVALRLPGDSAPTLGDAVTAEFPVPFIDATAESPGRADARVVVSQSLAPLTSLRASMDRWFLGAGLVTVALALAVAGLTSSRISRPLQDLADKTARIDLDRLDVDFDADGEDEIGSLSRLLHGMTARLRASATTLREAERRATVGDLARQLNHDIKNGLVPVRNVFRHLAQVAREQPAQLPALLLDRQGTIEAGISYLENLARNYARLTPVLDRQPCDLNGTIIEVVPALAAGAELRLDLSPSVPNVAADPLVIRRILENLVSNAVESLDAAGGEVSVTTAAANGIGKPGMVRLVVADQGRGMTEKELQRAFEDFYTTKPGGTGLGLSIIRRLVLDLNGTLRVETAPGSGTRFIVDLPAIEPPADPPTRRPVQS